MSHSVPMGDGDHAGWTAVVETPSYLARASKLLTEEEQQNVVTMLARDPTCGDVIKDTGGVRKVRIPLAGRGKSGGARVVYYFYNGSMPVFVYAIYAKNEKANLSVAERRLMAQLAAATREQYRRK